MAQQRDHLLAGENCHFGYRVANEIARYVTQTLNAGFGVVLPPIP